MKSKYFLRGMGVGILVTVMIFAVSLVFYEPDLSDEEIMKRASDLGMVQNEEESDSSSSEDKKTEDNDSSSSEDKKTENNDNSSEENDNNPKEVTDEETSSANDSSSTDSNNHSSLESGSDMTLSDSEDNSSVFLINFTVSTGESSYKICENLYRAGLIDDPNTFNKYLEDMGYDDTIRTGTYNIPSGSSYEEIANAISN